MPLPTLKIDATEASRQAMAHQQSMNKARRIPELPDMIKELSDQRKVYIFNVGPWAQQRYMGSLGSFYIPACGEGKEYSDPLVLPGIVTELYPNGDEFKLLIEKGGGEYVAQQIIGLGAHLDARNSFVKYGIFYTSNEKPTKEELGKARRELNKHYEALVNEANIAYSQGPKVAEETIRPDTHFIAARALKRSNAECPWLERSSIAAERSNCEGCGSVYVVGVMKCQSCGYILDPVKHKKAVAEGRFA